MEPDFCSARMKKLIKIWLSEGGRIQFDFLLKGGCFFECCCEKSFVSTCMF